MKLAGVLLCKKGFMNSLGSKFIYILFLPTAFLVYLFFQRYIILFVSTASMTPAIPKSSLIVVDTRPESFGLGEVVTFNYENRCLFTHRIVELTHEENSLFYVTKGDANDSPDDKTLTKSDIRGKVIFTLPYTGYLVLGILNPFFLLLFFYIPIGHYFGLLCKRFVNQIST